MKTLTTTLAIVTLLASCQPAPHSSTQSAETGHDDVPVQLDKVTDTQTVLRAEGEAITVSIGEIRQAAAAIFEINAQPVGLIQLKPAQNAEEAKNQCLALGHSWHILRDTDFKALLSSGNIGGIYNSMAAVPEAEGTLAFPAWVEAQTIADGSESASSIQLLTYFENEEDLFNIKYMTEKFGQEAADHFQTVAIQNTTVYCISGELK